MKRFFALLMAVCMASALFTACGNENGGSADTPDYSAEDVFNAIKKAYGDDFLPDEDMNEAEYTETYGLNMDDVEEIKAQIAMISFNPDRLLVVKCKEGKGEEVEKALSAARDSLIENGMWYPMNLPKVEASKVVRSGDYVAYIMLGQTGDDTVSEEEANKFAEEQIQKGVDAFNDLF